MVVFSCILQATVVQPVGMFTWEVRTLFKELERQLNAFAERHPRSCCAPCLEMFGRYT